MFVLLKYNVEYIIDDVMNGGTRGEGRGARGEGEEGKGEASNSE